MENLSFKHIIFYQNKMVIKYQRHQQNLVLGVWITGKWYFSFLYFSETSLSVCVCVSDAVCSILYGVCVYSHTVFVCLYMCLSLSVCQCFSLCLSLSVCVCLYLRVCVCFSLSLCVCVSLSIFVCLSVSLCLSVCVSLSQYVCLSQCVCPSPSMCVPQCVCVC